jgi:putative membrane protein
MMGYGAGFGLFGLVFMFLFWGGLILLAVWLVRAIFSSSTRHNSPPLRSNNAQTAQEILVQRYARGEITRDQYEIMKQDIS